MISSYKNYLNKLPYAVFICDKNLKVLYYNDSFDKIFEPESRRALIGKIIGCTEDFNNCGKNSNCKYCHLRGALESAIKSRLPSFSRRILKSVSTDSKIYFTMTVKKVGRHYMALIEDSLEMNLYNELMAARSLQQKMLPPSDVACGKRYAYFYKPSGEVGGDLLDVFSAQGLTCGFVADVSGRGIGAAMLSSFVKTVYDKNAPLLSNALSQINEKYRALKTDEREYITMLAVAVDASANKFYYTAAGHSVPLLHKNKNRVKELTTVSPPISNWFDSFSYEDSALNFSSGDMLVLITDGITEAKNSKGERFGLSRTKKILSTAECAQQFCSDIEKAVIDFGGDFGDDMSALAFDL